MLKKVEKFKMLTISKLRKILTELSSLVDSINANYVSKDDLNSTNLSIKNTVVVPLSIDDKNITSSDENNASVAPVQEKEVKQIDDSWKKKKITKF